jgi:hypothetical protein
MASTGRHYIYRRSAGRNCGWPRAHLDTAPMQHRGKRSADFRSGAFLLESQHLPSRRPALRGAVGGMATAERRSPNRRVSAGIATSAGPDPASPIQPSLGSSFGGQGPVVAELPISDLKVRALNQFTNADWRFRICSQSRLTSAATK